jgi:hypothetical protein
MEDSKFSIRILINHNKNKYIDLDREYQRGFTWSTEDKRLFIMSIISMIKDGLELPSMIVFNKTDNIYNCIDGKQRISAILLFIDGNFGYYDDNKNVYYDRIPSIYKKEKNNNYDAIIMTSQERELFNNYILTTKIYKNLSYEREVNLFMLINNGVPLSISETLMGHIKNKDMAISIKEIALDNQNKLSKYNCSERGKNVRFLLKLVFFNIYKHSIKSINNVEHILIKYESKNENGNKSHVMDIFLNKFIVKIKNVLDIFLINDLLLNDSIMINHNLKENSLVILLGKLANLPIFDNNKISTDKISTNIIKHKAIIINKANQYHNSIKELHDSKKNSTKKINEYEKISEFADIFAESIKDYF